MAIGQSRKLLSIGSEECASSDEHCADATLAERCKGCLDVGDILNIEHDNLLSGLKRRCQHVSSFGLCVGKPWGHEHGNIGGSWCKLAQQFQSLSTDYTAKKSNAGDITSWMVETFDKSILDRVASRCKQDRHNCRFGFCGDRRNDVYNDHRDRQVDEVAYLEPQLIAVIVPRAIFDHDVLAFDKSGFLEALLEGLHKMRGICKRYAAEKRNNRQLPLLRTPPSATARPPHRQPA